MAVAEREEMFGGGDAGLERVAADGRVLVGRLVDERDVESVERGGGERRRGDAGDDDAIDLPVAQRVEMLDRVAVLGLAEEHGVAGERGDLFRAGDHGGVDGIIEAGHDDTERERAAADEALRQPVGPIAEFLRDLQDARAGLGCDARFRVAREHERDRGLRHPGLPGHLGGRDTTVAYTHWLGDNRY